MFIRQSSEGAGYGGTMAAVFIKVITIFAMIGAGFAANKAGVLPGQSSRYISALLVYVTTPCLVLSTIASQELTGEMVRMSAEVIIGTIVFFSAASLVSYLIVKALKYEPESDRGALCALMTSANTGFMGFPVTKAIFGDKIFFLFIVQNILLNIYLYSGAILQISQGSGEKISVRKIAKALMNPCMAAALAGVILMTTGTGLPGPVMEFLTTMGSSTIPISMIVVGIQLGSSDLGEVLSNLKLMFCCFCNVVLMPLLTLAAVWLLPLTDASKLTLVFAAAFPSAVLIVAISETQNKNSLLLSQGVAMTTLMSMFTLPVWAIILMQLFSY